MTRSRVPLLIRWPGVTPAGSTHPHPVSHIDIVLAAMGQPVPRFKLVLSRPAGRRRGTRSAARS